MPNVTSISKSGNSLLVQFDDGSVRFAYPNGSGLYVIGGGVSPGDPGTGEDPTPTPTPSADPTSPDGIYNPWAAYSISGTWLSHLSYSAGGVDYPLAYGTSLKAPAAGTLHSSQTSGTTDLDTGWVGSAGRRSILVLDTDFSRTHPAETGEASGNMHAIVFQHQSVLGTNGAHFDKGAVLGKSGASANRDDYGGDVHLHVHGLNASGQRLNLLNFIP